MQIAPPGEMAGGVNLSGPFFILRKLWISILVEFSSFRFSDNDKVGLALRGKTGVCSL